MNQPDQDDDCVSKKPWSEVLSRSLKLFTFNAAKEGGRSFGRIIFYVVLAALILMVMTFVIDSFTGWFSSWFDFWPFNREAAVAPEPDGEGWSRWFARDDKPQDIVPVETQEGDAKWYCKWNPLC